MLELLKNKAAWSHYLAVAWAGAYGGFFTVQPWHDLVISVYNSLPHSAFQLVGGVVPLIMWYVNTNRAVAKK